MIIGASLGSFKGLGLKQAMELYLRLLDDFDLKAVEIRLEEEKGRPSMWSWELDNKSSEFLANFSITGAHLPFTDLNPISPNPIIRDESLKQLKAAIDAASKLKMSYAVMHARGFNHGLDHSQQLDEWEKVIGELADYAQKRSILLTVENGGSLGNLKELATMVRKINSKWFKITLDIGHAHVRRIAQESGYPLRGLALKALDATPAPLFSSKYMPYDEYGSIKNFLKSELDLIYNLHIHDYNGRKDHITIGSGKIDFSFLPLVTELPWIIEAEFQDHYHDFKINCERLIKIGGQE